MRERFDGATVWAGLSPDQQSSIGAAALELLAAWWAQEQAADPHDGSDPLLRAADAADTLLIHTLQERMVDAVPQTLLMDVDGQPLLPSLLGPVCRKCGCSQDDGCAVGCDWAEEDLCTACVEENANG